MAVTSYLVPLIGGAMLMATCYMLGRFNYSVAWIVILVGLNFLKSTMWRAREQRLMALRQAATQEKEVILAQLQDLPAWVQFPDTERVEWINKVILQLWPYVGEYTKVFLREVIEPQVRAQMPGPLKSFKFLQMDMGDIPCRVGGIKVYTHNVGRDRIIVDMDVGYAGDCEFTVGVAGFKGGLNEMVFSGKLRAVLKPLLPYPPMVGGVSAFFLENPKIDFNLTGMGEMVELPGLLTAIRSIINQQVANICVLPNEIVIPLAPNVDVTKLYFPEPDGVIRIHIVEAKNLENRDISFIKKGKSDPYAEIQVGSQFFKTRTIDNNLNPTWNEFFEAVVDQANGQKLRIELFDEDTASADEELGRLTIDLDDVRKRGTLDKWYPLEGCKHGDLHCKLHWMNLTTDIQDLEKQEWESEWMKSDKPIHPALLMVFIDNASDLPYPKAKLEPSPLIEVTLGKETQRTPVKVKTVNPLYQSKFMFFVKHPEGQELKIEARDDGTKRSLGEFILPLKALLAEPRMEYYQTTFPLTQGVRQSPIVVTIRLRAFRHGQQAADFHADHVTDILSPIFASKLAGNTTTRLAPSVAANGDVQVVEDTKTKDRMESAPNPELVLRYEGQKLKLGSVDSMQSDSQSIRTDRSFIDRFRGKAHRRSKDNDVVPACVGKLCMGLRYSYQTNHLVVLVDRIVELHSVESHGSADPYVSVKLMTTDGTQKAKMKTPIVTNSLNPVYDSQFEFDVHYNDLHNYVLLFQVKDATNYGFFAKTPVLGQIEFRLVNYDKTQQLLNQWVNLDSVA